MLSACGGGGGGGSGNLPPTASFTATPASGQAPLAVSFDASGSSDPDGTIASYAWNFGDGATGSGATASHTYVAAGTFAVLLTVTDSRGATASTTRFVTAAAGPPPASVAVSGRIEFERVPFSAGNADGLDYTRTFRAPARGVEVELIRTADGASLGSTATDTAGNYVFAAVAPNTQVFVRAKALSRFPGSAAEPGSWDLRILNNTIGNALYVLDGATFDTGVSDQVRNLLATTGWGGGFTGSYTGVRAAAPFAILDTLYAAAQFVISQGDSSAQFPPLNVYWSVDNRPVDGDPSSGDIGTTLYRSGGAGAGIYVLGQANVDTDEFDQHVVAHEFYHYLEDTLSRADTIGGSHSLQERLDLRVAFSEGFGNAFSAMPLGDPRYRDSYGAAQAFDFDFNVESETVDAPGWYAEGSVQRIVYDLYDPANEAGDAVALGFAPLYDVLVTELRDGVPLASVFSFITALKQRPGVPAALVDSRVEAEGDGGPTLGIVSATMDAYASTETHSGVAVASADLSLPVFAPIAVNGPSVRMCASSELTLPGGQTIQTAYNKLGNRRLLRFSVPAAQSINIAVRCPQTDSTCTGLPQPDPDFVLWRAGQVAIAEDAGSTTEQRDINVAAGDYVLEIYEYSHVDPSAITRRGRTCMSVTITG
jgi:PKD repeat protein